mmetsp:Transcript_49344/g.127298  ORF Transcript_49344/g.127298 Transcript_49344/m.127298 type:complete len:297 (-) Transcript_49344:245-1135(-)
MLDEAQLEQRQDVMVLLRVCPGHHERGLLTLATETRISPAADEELSNLCLILHRGQGQRRQAGRVLLLHRCLGIQQGLGNRQVAILAGVVQGSPAADVLGHGVRSALQQSGRRLDVACGGRAMQRGLAVLIDGVDLGLGLQQHAHHGGELRRPHRVPLGLIAVSSQVEGRPAAVIRSARKCRVMGEKALDALNLATLGRQHQRGQLGRVAQCRVRIAVLEQHRYDLCAVHGHGLVQRCLPELVAAFSISSGCEQLHRQVRMALCTGDVQRRPPASVRSVHLAAARQQLLRQPHVPA